VPAHDEQHPLHRVAFPDDLRKQMINCVIDYSVTLA
jgi:hypothetical protein